MKRLIGRTRRAMPALAVCLLLVRGRCEAAPPEASHPVATSRAWEFADLDGGRHTVEWQTRDPRAVLVFFFDLQSPDSLLAMNYFDALVNRAGDFGLSVVGVDATGRPAADVLKLLRGFTSVYRTPAFPVTADPDFATAKRFESRGAPTSLLVGEGGKIVLRNGGFDLGTAVEITRSVERLLRRDEGFFSLALRDVGLGELKERELGARAAAAEREDQPGAKALTWGDRVPALGYRDTAGRAGRWAWPSGAVIRVAFFWNGASPRALEDLAFFQGLLTRGMADFLDIIAVESTGLRASVVSQVVQDGRGGRTALSFPVVPDPQRRLVGYFGAGNPLPQTFLVGGNGEVLFRADGLGPGEQQMLEDKIVRAMRLADLGLPQVVREVPRVAGPGADGAEAPSVSRHLERNAALRFNLSQGDYFFTSGQHARAVTYYRRYLELEPASVHALVRLAQIHDILREPATAREFWERVLAISPGHAEARSRLDPLRGR